ncbi:competence protein ComEC [Clostridium punense]|uniref:Competence protein ComEC n=2 Tax=Clostridium TaxID=1485 RepID=A0ABS4K8G6_9CLOT|nr:ComEC/Rec2 family competence protein [Clostridium punense]MBP2024071.1 competence protein ComEC [Clostridium punense]
MRISSKKKYLFFSSLMVSLVFFTYVYLHNFNDDNSKINRTDLVVHFIDVGQGDCILVQARDKNLLIDSGSNSSSKKVIHYIKKLKIKKIDYVIATHPHEDHIGAMDDILKNFEIEAFYAPKVTSSAKDFTNLVKELANQNKKISILKSGMHIKIYSDINLEVLSPKKDTYENINNYSPVMQLNFNEINFLFTGDSEKVIEEELLLNHINLSSQVIKVGHHGSKTSTSVDFLNKVNPMYAVISCGLGNDYGHPDSNVIKLLKEKDIKIFRTDKDGNILLYSDGKTLLYSTINNK